jgi:hypothetical protein
MRLSVEHTCEAVAMLHYPGVNGNQVEAELWIGANVLGVGGGSWRRRR